jgi:hypothetical protein
MSASSYLGSRLAPMVVVLLLPMGRFLLSLQGE